MAKRKKTGQCAYCGKHGEVTRDHVPPRCLFKPPLPANMITVSACPECHDEFKLDDEYFRTWLSLRPDVFAGNSGEFLWEKTLRSLKAPEARNFRNKLLSSLTQVEVHSEGGIYLCDATGIRYTTKRLKATANRILRGIFAFFSGYPLPSSHKVSIFFEEFAKDKSVLQTPELTDVLDVLATAPLHSRGPGVLALKYFRTAEDTNSTAWVVQILESVTFFGFTLPVQIEKDRHHQAHRLLLK